MADASDPVAARSSFLCMYMSNHPDTLVAYVCHAQSASKAGRPQPPVLSAKMTAIDSKGMTLSYIAKGSDSQNEIRIPFDPPLLGYEEVKPRLLAMKTDAEEALGLTSPVKITTFSIPSDAWIPFLMETLLVLATWPPASAPPFAALRDLVGPQLIKWSWVIVAVFHSMEALFATYLCLKNVSGWAVQAKWILGTFLFGFPFLTLLRKRIQAARIASFNKNH
ncbi:hypothetical protein BOTBODRAFT_37990 [Botryobasidium botryosum FD-172 SS1]|uniref:DUF2470 domain-containing protein n=1 Tax=Botryobasidium botryosum (strain FD-172 SS1) TaxID=930990 RepID=A0A067M999_BOTB1|nr:hypothetical protein BOTBODRAFT_37990 [Botryobasidium botryosum FD-172 SS1]